MKIHNVSDKSNNKYVKLDDSIKIKKKENLHKVDPTINAMPVWNTDQKKPEFLCQFYRSTNKSKQALNNEF